MSKRFFVVLLGIILIGGALVWYMGGDDTDTPSNGSTAQPTSHTYGDGEAGVVLVEYGDFQCPACGAYYPIVKEIKETYREDITFQFRHYPLTQIHPNAMAAHRAAEAAAMQGKFWEMHDLLYEGQQSWSSLSGNAAVTAFENYAQQLELDLDKFKADFASSAVNNVINADVKEGQNINATSTPTFVLEGKKIEENPRTFEDFSKLIDDAIAAKGGAAEQADEQ